MLNRRPALDEPLVHAALSSKGYCCAMGFKLLGLSVGLAFLMVLRQGLLVQEPAVTAAWQDMQLLKPQKSGPLRQARGQYTQPVRVGQSAQLAKPHQFRKLIMPVASATGVAISSPAAAQKAQVFRALDAGSNADVRAALATALPALVASNPTIKPAHSSLLTGNWAVRYVSSTAPGGLDVVRVKRLSLHATRVPSESIATIAVRLPTSSKEVDVEVVADLRADGPEKLVETPKKVRFKGGIPVPLLPILPSREIFVQYLDNDLLVVSDAAGSPDILVRA